MQSFVSVFLIDGYSQLSNLLVSRRVQVDAQTGQARTGEVPDKPISRNYRTTITHRAAGNTLLQ